jgi:hypothetical protein
MAILKPAPVSSRQFDYSHVDGYVAEISSTNGLGRVYDDACDEGLTLVSQRTGREVVFVVDEVERRDGDVLLWRLVPAKPSESRVPMTLFND